jgi:hypothetical protein
MGKCPKCGKNVGFFSFSVTCVDCVKLEQAEKKRIAAEKVKKDAEHVEQLKIVNSQIYGIYVFVKKTYKPNTYEYIAMGNYLQQTNLTKAKIILQSLPLFSGDLALAKENFKKIFGFPWKSLKCPYCDDRIEILKIENYEPQDGFPPKLKAIMDREKIFFPIVKVSFSCLNQQCTNFEKSHILYITVGTDPTSCHYKPDVTSYIFGWDIIQENENSIPTTTINSDHDGHWKNPQPFIEIPKQEEYKDIILEYPTRGLLSLPIDGCNFEKWKNDFCIVMYCNDDNYLYKNPYLPNTDHLPDAYEVARGKIGRSS